MQNNKYRTHDVKKICTTKLDLKFEGAKEFNAWFSLNGKKIARLTVSMGRKSIKPKTYGSMARQLKLTISQFDELLDCSLSRSGYETLLRKAGGQ